MNWLLIGIGGSLGAISRYSISVYFSNKKRKQLATFIVNIIGSLLFGAILASNMINENLNAYIFFTAGFLGAFTTFSTFTYETISLIENGNILKAIVYISFHILIIFSTVLIGYFIW